MKWTATTEIVFFEMERLDGLGGKGLILHQLWVDQSGRTEWRRVPIVKLNDREGFLRR